MENLVVLMAGGLGSRLRPLTDTCPKPMLKVRGQPILEGILRSFVSHGFRRFAISVNYLGDQIRDHFGDGAGFGAEITYLWDTVRMGTAGALGLLLEMPADPIFVMNGDVIAEVNFADMLRFHEHRRAALTIAAHERSWRSPYGLVEFDGFQVTGIREKPELRNFINAGIYVLSPETLGYIQKGKALDMPDLILDLLRREKHVAAFPIWGTWLDIGTPEALELAERELRR